MRNEASAAGTQAVQKTQGIADLLAEQARNHGNKEALVCQNERINFQQLNERAMSCAEQLRSIGLVPGDRIGIFLPNCSDYVAGFFGAIGLGCIVVPINPLLKVEEISHILADSQAKALIVQQALLPIPMEALPDLPALESIIVATESDSNETFKLPIKPNKNILALRRTSQVDHSWPNSIDSSEQIAVIVYTSGTTGKPKGAVLTHNNLTSIFPARLDLFEISAADRCLAVLPLCHIYGMTVVMIGSIACASTLIVIPKFEPKLVLEAIQNERVTLLPAVPAMYQFLLAELQQNKYNLNTVRICFSGAAPLPAPLIEKISKAFDAPVIEGYALTETACVATTNPLHRQRKAGSVGIAVPGVEIAILDSKINPLPPGQEHVGEIAVKGPNVMRGYYLQPEASSQVLQKNWFLTGDLGYKDEEGYLFIVGRKKELIIRGGANIYPREVEDAIMRLPGITEVAVIGVPDAHMGERVKAIVVSSNPGITELTIKNHCAELLADFKVPRLVEFVAALPRNSTGKVLKRLLS